MRAVVYYGNMDARLESVPEPDPGPRDVKLRVDYCGICSSDIKEYAHGPLFMTLDPPNPITGKKVPLIMGHEITGTVVETGREVSGLRPGDRTVVQAAVACGECSICRNHSEAPCPNVAGAGFGADGGLAEYMTWPASHVVKIPDHLSSEEAALVEPASVAVHAVRRSRLQPGESAAVLGCGPVGLLIIQTLKAKGGRVIAVDNRQMSLDMAKEVGAEATVNTGDGDPGEMLREFTGGDGPDMVFDVAGGEQTPVQAIEWARMGGRAILVAIYSATSTLHFNSIVANEREVIGSLAYQRRDVEEAVRLVAAGEVRTRPLISDTISLEDAGGIGFRRMVHPTKDFFRILVSPGD